MAILVARLVMFSLSKARRYIYSDIAIAIDLIHLQSLFACNLKALFKRSDNTTYYEIWSLNNL